MASPHQSLSASPTWADVLGAYEAACQDSDRVDQSLWLQQYPQFADQLREYFANQDDLERRFQPLRAALQLTPLPGGELTSPPRASSAVPLPGPGDVLGGYLIERELARGGMGVVYQAHQTLGDRPRAVALKVLLHGAGTRRFHEEAATTGRFDHPHIVPVYEQGEDQGRSFFAMKFYAGGSLERAVKQGTWNRDQRAAAALLADVARAVQHAHQHRVLHRDLKPGNVLLDEAGRPGVSDFGIARRLDAGGTLSVEGAIVGTPSYMSPEQARGEVNLTTATDVYGLGAILYFVLTRQPPHSGDDLLQVIRKVREEEPLAPRSLNPALNRDLESICLKCLDKDPQRRYASAEALATDLQRWLHHEPIQARRIGPLGKLRRWCRRSPFVASLLGVIFALLLGTAVAAQFGLGRLRREQASTKAAYREARHYLYAANMKLAQQSWSVGNVRRTLELLERHRPNPDEDDLRGFEWHYLDRQSHSGAVTLDARDGGIVALQFVPGNQQLVAVTAAASVVWWDLQTNQVKERLPLGLDALSAVRFSADARYLAVATHAGSVQLWDLRTRQGPLLLRGHRFPALGLAFSADATRLATVSTDQLLKVWEVATGKEQLSLNPHNEGVSSVAFAPNGTALATGSVSGEVKLWDAATGKVLNRVHQHQGPIRALAFSLDGQLLASSGFDTEVKMLDFKSGQRLGPYRGHRGEVKALSFVGKEQLLISAGTDSTVRLWHSGEPSPRLTLRGHLGSVTSLALSADEQRIATGSSDGTVKLWDIEQRGRETHLVGHREFVFSLSFSSDSRTLVSGGVDQVARFWDSSRGVQTRGLEGHSSTIYGALLTPDGQTLVSAGVGKELGGGARAGEVRFWDVPSGKEQQAFRDLPERVVCLSLSPDGATAAAGCLDGTLWLGDVSGRRELARLRRPQGIRALAFSPDGTRLASASPLSTRSANGPAEVTIWDVAARKDLVALRGHEGEIWSLAFSPNGRQLASGSTDHTVKLWDLASEQMVATFDGHTGPVRGVVFDPSGRRLVSVGDDREVRLWDLTTREELASFEGHQGAIWSVAFAPDGRTLATGDRLGVIRLWRAGR